MTWSHYTIGNLVDRQFAEIQTGPFGTQLRASDYVSEGIPVINVRNIGYGNLRPEKLEYVTEQTSERLYQHVLTKDDIVFGRKGAVDRHVLVKEIGEGWLQGSDCIRLRIYTPTINPAFVSCAFLLHSHKDWMLTQSSSKATMASLNQDVIRRIPLRVPDRRVQDDIVRAVGTYDYLIENNRRRIQLLEQSARLLYKEWFVHLRFPGHEHVKIVDGMPKGWERLPFVQVCDSIGGGTPSTTVTEYWDGDITWVTPSDVTKSSSLYLLDSEKKITEAGLRGSSAKMLPPDAILMTSRASIGFFAVANRPVCTNQGFIAVVPKVEYSRSFLLFHLMSRVEEFRSRASGSTFKELSKGKFRELSVIWPARSICREFEDHTAPILAQIQSLAIMNAKLVQARDLLLPRLMSGEIEV